MHTRAARTASIVVLFLIPFAATAEQPNTASGVTFEFTPERWQTAICLPDDPYKTLVDSDGTLLYHYEKGNFGTRVRVVADPGASTKKQQLLDARIPIVQTTRQSETLTIVEEAFAVADGKKKIPGPSRNDVLLVSVTNHSSQPQTIKPQLLAHSTYPITASGDNGLQINGHEVVLSSDRSVSVSIPKDPKTEDAALALNPIRIEPGETARFAFVYCGGETIDSGSVTLEKVLREREHAEAFWRHVDLPYGRVTVPDAGVQALIDGAIRNIWQAREIKNGLPAFQVGPTCYRGLWIVDGSFLLEAAAMLGAGDQARAGIEYMLSFQKEDGRFEIMNKYHKENGIVLWACARHAQLTQDKAWLESEWPKLERTVDYIKRLRQETLTNDSPLDDGLMPPGYADGGIGRNDLLEYTNVYWNLLGLKSIVQAARWLGKDEQAKAWAPEYEDFMAKFRAATERDTRSDVHGNRFLPILMTLNDSVLASPDAHWYIPAKGQWGFCHGVYPGQLFEKSDPLVTGNLAMLQSYEQEGMVVSTGWMTGGIWNYFASFYAHAWLWNGDGKKAANCFYAMANHASPLLAWREEQVLKGQPYQQVGDMPHNWASAEFIRLAIHLLALDRGSELHLFEGMPAAWAQPGMTTALDKVATPFGPLTFTLKISDDGSEAVLKIGALSSPSCSKIVLHQNTWTHKDASCVLELKPNEAHTLHIPL